MTSSKLASAVANHPDFLKAVSKKAQKKLLKKVLKQSKQK